MIDPDEVLPYPIRIPRAVLGGEISSLAVHIVVELIGNYGGHVCISEQHIAESVGRQLRPVRRALRELECAGILKVTRPIMRPAGDPPTYTVVALHPADESVQASEF